MEQEPIHETTLFTRIALEGLARGVLSEQQLIDLDNIRIELQEPQPDLQEQWREVTERLNPIIEGSNDRRWDVV